MRAWPALLGCAVVLGACVSGTAGPSRAPAPTAARLDPFERVVMAEGYTRVMADCALTQAARSGMTAAQLLHEYRVINDNDFPDALTNTAYDALAICGLPH